MIFLYLAINTNVEIITICKFSVSFDCYKFLQQAFIHSINLKKAVVGQPKYCNNAYVHIVLTNLCSIFSIFTTFSKISLIFES